MNFDVITGCCVFDVFYYGIFDVFYYIVFLLQSDNVEKTTKREKDNINLVIARIQAEYVFRKQVRNVTDEQRYLKIYFSLCFVCLLYKNLFL